MSHTKIPGISSHKRPLGSPERLGMPSKRTHVLGDVTNTIAFSEYFKNSNRKYTMPSTAVADPNMRLMNRYYYGDPKVIEEVKKRERKIARDIQHFRKSIVEIDTETRIVHERELPDLRYEISKKNALCNELRKDLIEFTSKLDEKTNDCDTLKRDGELDLQHTQLKHQVALQEVQNELDQNMSKCAAEWEAKLREIDNERPDPALLVELEELQKEKHLRNAQTKELAASNNLACEKKTQELGTILEQLLIEKQEPLHELQAKSEAVQKDNDMLRQETDSVKGKISQYEDRCSQLMQQISTVDSLITECMEERAKNLEAKKKAEVTYLDCKTITDAVQEEALIVESQYNQEFDKMEKEQTRRRVMENSIDELRGKIRCFAFVGDEMVENSSVDYFAKTIALDETKPCTFNRIVPRKLIEEQELINQECEPFFLMCLNKQLNFSLMSSPTGRQLQLKRAFLEYLLTKENKLLTQYVSLSEGSESCDLFLPAEQNVKTDIQLTLKKDAIEINSTTLEMRSTQDVDENAALLESSVDSGNVGILKAEIWKDQNKCCDAYFLEVNDLKTMEMLGNSRITTSTTKPPMAIILQTLLLKTKSLFLFNLFDKDTARPSILLDAASHISHLETSQTPT
ncbi:LAFA_0F05732g1_1 [Lachancea sp. 'fantastica']|nr:LAFA_0F05732g1_1 [Lachancea sp. 'fantastica']